MTQSHSLSRLKGSALEPFEAVLPHAKGLLLQR